jgi:uncharacterized protein YmfQ (DUF2313 family)
MRRQEKAFRAETLLNWSFGGESTDIQLDKICHAEGEAGIRIRSTGAVSDNISAVVSYESGRDLSLYDGLNILAFIRVESQDSGDIEKVGLRFTDTDGNYKEWQTHFFYREDGAYHKWILSNEHILSNNEVNFAKIEEVEIKLYVNGTPSSIGWCTIDDIYGTDTPRSGYLQQQLPSWWDGGEDPFIIALDEIYRDLSDRIQQFVADTNLSDPSESVISAWEKLLGLPVQASYQMAERTARITKLFSGTSSTIASIRAITQKITGIDPIIYESYHNKNATGDDFFTYIVYVPSPAVAGYDDALLQTELEAISPAHCILRLSFTTDVSDTASTPTDTVSTIPKLQGGSYLEGGSRPFNWGDGTIWL